ncbi:MAG: hypothetical protein N2999_02910, partial [Proteobacteria bacterium]|nr:hypothetical protein [Pseudomonadota bacterium]
PPYRYGSCINFPVKRTYRYEGFIKIKEKETSKPLSFKEIYLRQIEYKEDEEEKSFCKSPFGDIKEKKEGIFFTSAEGDFYIENVKPGRYLLEFKLLGRDIKYEIELPSLEEVLINLGEIEIKIPEE